MTIELEEVGPNRWRVKRPVKENRRAENMPLPFVISDNMEPTEQVDGKFYTSKRAFRATGRALGLVEVGNEKLKPKPKNAGSRAAGEARRASIQKAVEKIRT
jgi:hypothetical protein